LTWYIAAAILAAVFAFVRTPYSLIMPGSAIDVRDIVRVDGHEPPRERYYMTDVTLQESATPAVLLAAFLPGTRVLPTRGLVPQGIGLQQYDKLMVHAMTESQTIAAFVAERAAQLPVGILRSHVSIATLDPVSHAKDLLRVGDAIVAVNGKTVSATIEIQNILYKIKPGALVSLTFERGGERHNARFATVELQGKSRLGVYLLAHLEAPKLPVPVRFKRFDVSGSSGGLMFALDIYRSIHPYPAIPLQRIAGTGTIDYGGVVGEIEGTQQKLIAARKAGAQVFLVPRENYHEVAGTRDIKIVPVHTFAQALGALL